MLRLLKWGAIGFGGFVAFLIIIVIVLSVAGGGEDEATDSAAAQQTSGSDAAATATAEQPGLGDLVRVGSLDLTIHSVEPVDTTGYNMFNNANLAVKLTATNARGSESGEYRFSPILALKIVDERGVILEPSLACAGCPDDITSGVALARGGTISGTVYYEVPEGVKLTEIRYEPLFSTNKATIRLED